MNRLICLLASAFVLSGGVVYAQGELDAYKYSQYDLNGTARYLGMGGAFGALGGDISVMSANPAGLGIYRSSEVVTTISLSSINAKSDWNGSTASVNKTKFNFDNIAYVGYFPTGNDEGLVSWNVGFGYNRLKNFNRSYRMSGVQNYSLADYAAAIATLSGIDQNKMPSLGSGNNSATRSIYESLAGSWLPALAYQSGIIGGDNEVGGNTYHSSFAEWDEKNQRWYSDSRPDHSLLDVNERGAIDRYNISFATNISNRVFIGATVAVTDLNYRLSSEYTEEYAYTDGSVDRLLWDNIKSTDGTGYSFNIGAIVRPSDFLRLGVAYASPTWYKMKDSYVGYGTSEIGYYDPPVENGQTPSNPDPYTDYKLKTADKWIFSAAGIIGQTALISVDYELSNYKYMKLYYPDGYEYDDNKGLIQKRFGLSHTVKVGAEVKVTPQFAVRAGANWTTSPMNAELRNGEVEVFTAGTVAHYTLDKGSSLYSVGLGYRFTPHFYMDLACVYRQYKETAYAFSNVIDKNDNVLVKSEGANLKTNTTQVALTLGYKF